MKRKRTKSAQEPYKVGSCYKITKVGPRTDVTEDEAGKSGISTLQWAVGFLASPVEIGSSVIIQRFIADGGRLALGLYCTSALTELGPANYLRSQRSIYILQEVSSIDVHLLDGTSGGLQDL